MTTIGPTYPAHILVNQADIRLVADETSNADATSLQIDERSLQSAEQIEQSAAKSSINIVT
jgi:hypothetical protein